MKRTKIVCTIGPASEKQQMLEEMMRAGMNVCRLNFSHGTYENHALLIKNIRAAAKKVGITIAILGDLQGPRIRVGELPKEGVQLERGKTVTLTTAKSAIRNPQSNNLRIPVTYPKLHIDLRRGDHVLLNDGNFELVVEKISGREIYCTVLLGGLLTSHKGINVPGRTLSIGSLTAKDKSDVKFLVKQGVDFIALSFVKNAADVKALRKLLPPWMQIVVKIEKHEAIKNFKEILAATDAVMVARGDLGLEMPTEDIPVLQRQIIDQCLAAAKPVIVATQMLESMKSSPRPTRAEASDVSHAVMDHTDATMLSAESAAGQYPLESVATMAAIIARTEKSVYDNLILPKYSLSEPRRGGGSRRASTSSANDPSAPTLALGRVARILAESSHAKAIVAASRSGLTARILSRYRPELPIYVGTDNEHVMRQMALVWGVRPLLLPTCQSEDQLAERLLKHLVAEKYLKRGDAVVLVVGDVSKRAHANRVEAHIIKSQA